MQILSIQHNGFTNFEEQNSLSFGVLPGAKYVRMNIILLGKDERDNSLWQGCLITWIDETYVKMWNSDPAWVIQYRLYVKKLLT